MVMVESVLSSLTHQMVGHVSVGDSDGGVSAPSSTHQMVGTSVLQVVVVESLLHPPVGECGGGGAGGSVWLCLEDLDTSEASVVFYSHRPPPGDIHLP